jgi:hypothetical protein
MALWKDFPDPGLGESWTAYFMHFGGWIPNDATSCHVFGYSLDLELPVGVAGYVRHLSEPLAELAAKTLFANANSFALTCPNCSAFAFTPTRPHWCTLTQPHAIRAYLTPDPYWSQPPPALYAGRIIYWPDIEIPDSFNWTRWPRQ